MFLGEQAGSRSPGRLSLATRLFPSSVSSAMLYSAMLYATASAQAKPSADAGAADDQRGIAALERGDLIAARAGFDKAVQANPSSAEAQSMLAQVLLRQGQVEEAIAHFRQLIELRPELAVAHTRLGQAYETQGNFESAAEELRRSVKLAPSEAEPHPELGRALSLQKKTAEAVSELSAAVRLSPSHAELHDELGSLLAQQSEYTKANPEFREAIRLNPQYEQAYLHLGVTFLASSDSSNALPELDHALQLDSRDAKAWFYRGTAEESLGNREEALRSFQRTDELAPSTRDLQQKPGPVANSARRRQVCRQQLSPPTPVRGSSPTAIWMAPFRNFALPSTPRLTTPWPIISWRWPSHNKVRKTNPAVNFRKRRNWIRTWWFHTSL